MECSGCHVELANDAQFCGSCGLPSGQREEINAEIPDPRVGLVLDSKYKLLEHLGEGGMGSVFRASRLHIGDEVAVKLLHRDLVREKQALERFRREARAAASIRHPNVVSIHDFSDGASSRDGNSEAYIVMELVNGVSLGNLLRREGRMLPRRAVALMQDVCAGVGVAHREGLLHRDLKPDNVIVTPPSHEHDRESAKVVDFGLAKVRDVAASTALTHTGAVLGTLYYMSPEQCSGEELDARADIYSLGAMLYEMLTGGPPFRSSNLAGLIAKHLHEPPPPFPPPLEIPPALAHTCFRALAKDRNDRQSDAIAFGRELSAALSAPVAQRPRARSFNKALVVVPVMFLAVVMLIGAAVGVYYVVSRARAGRESIRSESVNLNVRPDTPLSSGESIAGLKGTWAGTYGPFGSATKLIINHQAANEFDGVLEQGTVRVAFKGTYDPPSRSVRLTQTRVLSGEGWSLGEDVGTLSADGTKLSGTGRDAVGGTLGISYDWSFQRP